MISIFNTTKTNWAIESMKNDKMTKIKFTKNNGNDRPKSFELVVSSSIAFDDKFKTLKTMTEPEIVFTDNTEVRYLKKTSAPMIVVNSNEKYKKDIILISVTMYGQILKTIIGKNAYVLNYMIAKGELVMAVSIGGEAEDEFSFILHNTTDHTDMTYTFVKDLEKGVYTVSTKSNPSEDVLEAPTYKIRKFRPSRPTHLICADIKDKKKLEDMKRINPDKFDIIYAKDSIEATKHLENKISEGYKAVTVFGASKAFFGTYNDVMEFVKTNFRIVNVLRYDGGIMRL